MHDQQHDNVFVAARNWLDGTWTAGATDNKPTLRDGLVAAIRCNPKLGMLAYWEYFELRAIYEQAVTELGGPHTIWTWSLDEDRTFDEIAELLTATAAHSNLHRPPHPTLRPWVDPKQLATTRIPFTATAAVCHIAHHAPTRPISYILRDLEITNDTDPWTILERIDPHIAHQHTPPDVADVAARILNAGAKLSEATDSLPMGPARALRHYAANDTTFEQLNDRLPPIDDTPPTAHTPARHYDNLTDLVANAEPSDFICIDTETANDTRSSICSIGIALVRGHAIAASADELINPQCEFNAFNTRVNGIDALTVANARPLQELWGDLSQLCENQTLVFHNAAFDIGVLRASAARHNLTGFNAKFICTMRTARRAWPELPGYGLAVLCAELDIDLDHHQAGSDARGCAEVAIQLLEATGANDLADLYHRLEMGPGALGTDSFTPISTQPAGKFAGLGADPSADPEHPLFGLTVCFTGTLLSMVRREAAELVSKAGGRTVNNMSKIVDLLIVGDVDYLQFADGQRTGKLARAAQLRSEGHGPEIVGEADFLHIVA